jgi:hypothetical protein
MDVATQRGQTVKAGKRSSIPGMPKCRHRGARLVKAKRSQAGDLRLAGIYWRMRRLTDQGQASGRIDR